MSMPPFPEVLHAVMAKANATIRWTDASEHTALIAGSPHLRHVLLSVPENGCVIAAIPDPKGAMAVVRTPKRGIAIAMIECPDMALAAALADIFVTSFVSEGKRVNPQAPVIQIENLN